MELNFSQYINDLLVAHFKNNRKKNVLFKKCQLENINSLFTLILSTLASSFSCSTNRRMLDKLELEVMSAGTGFVGRKQKKTKASSVSKHK